MKKLKQLTVIALYDVIMQLWQFAIEPL